MSRSILRGGIGSVIVRIAAAAASFIIAMLLARMLGPSGYGLYAYVISIITILAVLTQSGLSTLVVREVARYHSRGNSDALKGLLRRSIEFVLGSSLLLAVLTLLGLRATNASTAFDHSLGWGLILLPCLAFCSVAAGALRGLGFVIYGQICDQLARPLFFIALLALTLMTSGQVSLSPERSVQLHAVGALLAAALGLIVLRSLVSRKVVAAPSSFADQRRWFRSLMPLSMIAGLQVVIGQTDVVMLGALASAEEVGIYRVALQISSLISLVLFALGLSIEPLIARLNANEEIQRLQHVMTSTGRVAFLLSVAATLAFVAFGRQLLSSLFGDAFEPAYWPAVILCLGQLVLAVAGWAVLLLNMTGNEQITLRYAVFAAVLNAISNVILIDIFGVLGAASATCMTLGVWKLVLSRAAYRATGVHSFIFRLKPRNSS